MLRLLFVALLIESPNSAAESNQATQQQQEYTLKKVCQTQEVPGTAIPRRSCVTKKVPVKKKPAAPVSSATRTDGTASESTAGSKD